MITSSTKTFLSVLILRVIQKVCSLRRGGGIIEKQTKTNKRKGRVLACVYFRFLKRNAEIFKMKFYSYSPVFPIDYNGSMKYQTNHREIL